MVHSSDLESVYSPSPSILEEILKDIKTIAVVGMSQDPHRPSKRVGLYMRKHGYDIIPVNPRYETILNMQCYPTLSDIPVKIDVVNVFLASHRLAPVVDEALAVNAKVLWLQEGVVDETLAKKAMDAGMIVVMDRCIMKDHLSNMR